jgi:tubulin polyglutamylase TTLL5
VGNDAYGFFPRTFSLPHQHRAWRAAVEADPAAIWITKPKRGAKGHGVRVVTDTDAVVADPDFIVQQYITSPLLVPEYPHKHIIRIYVAVTSLDPLIAYVHRQTFVRFASRPFGLAPVQLTDPIRHITNPSVQLTNPDLDGGIRIMSWAAFGDLLARATLDAAPLWPRIRAMLAKVLAAHRRPMQTVTERNTPHPSSCFELLGYDVLIDDQLMPRLIECNMSPLLSVRGADGSTDRLTHESVKGPVIDDLLGLVGVGAVAPFTSLPPLDRFEAELARRGGFEPLAPNRALHATMHALGDLSPLDEALWDQWDPAVSRPVGGTRC